MITSFVISKYSTNNIKNDPINMDFVVSFYIPKYTIDSKTCITFELVGEKFKRWLYDNEQDANEEYKRIINIILMSQILQVNVVDKEGRTIGNG